MTSLDRPSYRCGDPTMGPASFRLMVYELVK